MTATHCSMNRRNLIEMGFEFDTVLFEEAGQILEIENFIALNLQRPKFSSQSLRLQRVIMVGDDCQLPPIIKNIVL